MRRALCSSLAAALVVVVAVLALVGGVQADEWIGCAAPRIKCPANEACNIASGECTPNFLLASDALAPRSSTVGVNQFAVGIMVVGVLLAAVGAW